MLGNNLCKAKILQKLYKHSNAYTNLFTECAFLN